MNEQNYTTLETPRLQGKTIAESLVLIVDDESASRLVLSSIIEDIARCKCLSGGEGLIDVCRQEQPTLIVMDVNIPGKDGLQLCSELKGQTDTSEIPVVFITSDDSPALQDKCWQVGASDFIVKPVVSSTLTHRVKNLLVNQLRLELLRQLTFRDQLTGLYNRYYLSTEIPSVLKQLVREQQPIGVIMVDIDYFKRFNDTYGHLEGDKCLHSVANTLMDCLRRPRDCIIRYGGEEFIIFLPNTDLAGCKLVGDKLIDNVRLLNIVNKESPYGVVTVSAGLFVCMPDQNSTLEDIITESDQLLFDAKDSGRNQLKGRSDI